jgi:hypothetical protein
MKTTALPPFSLPPLILHPFSSNEESSLLAESSQASLTLQGFSSTTEAPWEELDRTLRRGRYAELRMLFYIGKDVTRWAEQCAESAAASDRYRNRQIRPETFVYLLVQHTPDAVGQKLERWGVKDYRTLFRRSFGLHAIFQDIPPTDLISQDFLRRYHRYLDHCYEQRLQDRPFDRPQPDEFAFDLFASGEYSSMLEKSWEADVANRSF